ncbi:N-terminal phage integrase SAM-like domain-containing protein [Streptomyces scopuliridis]|nr:N-terminal phage integrase SAM-like domain-containing protein [Streptomyces scopuliridis]
MALGQWFDYWLQCIVKPDLAQGSYRTYEQTVRNHLRPRLGSKVMVKLGVKELRGAMTRLAEEKGPRPLSTPYGSSLRRWRLPWSKTSDSRGTWPSSCTYGRLLTAGQAGTP